MSEGDRNTMIRGMVDRLATRLKDNGNDVEGWLRLVRAYMVLGERDKAQAALADARQAVGNDAARPRSLAYLVLPHAIATAIFAPLVFSIAERVHAATTVMAPRPGEGATR